MAGAPKLAPARRPVVFALDDEQENLDLIARALHQSCEVRRFNCGRLLLAAVADALPDLLLVDFRMPQSTGLEVLTALRNGGIHCPALLITAFSDLEEVRRARKDGLVFRVITKPWRVEDLRSNVTLALSLSKLGKAVADMASGDPRG